MRVLIQSYAMNCQTTCKKDGSDAVTPLPGERCRDCCVLFDVMRSAAKQATAIARQARILIHAIKPSEDIDEWEQIRERWEAVRIKWVLAAADLNNHLVTAPRYARPGTC